MPNRAIVHWRMSKVGSMNLPLTWHLQDWRLTNFTGYRDHVVFWRRVDQKHTQMYAMAFIKQNQLLEQLREDWTLLYRYEYHTSGPMLYHRRSKVNLILKRESAIY